MYYICFLCHPNFFGLFLDDGRCTPIFFLTVLLPLRLISESLEADVLSDL